MKIVQYKIGPWSFFPEKCLLKNDEIEKELEPLLFKLLMYFVQNPKKIITREELATEVWRQSYVDDNAINRAISELRKQLTTPQYKSLVVRTHYRKGYSMNVPVVLVSNELKNPFEQNPESKEVTGLSNLHSVNSDKSEQENSYLGKRLTHIVLYGLFVFLLIVFVYLASIHNNANVNSDKPVFIDKTEHNLPNKVSVRAVNNLSVVATTKNVGAEYYPNTSSNKRFLSYVNKTDHQTKSYVRELSSSRDIEIKYDSFEVEVLSWQPASEKFLAKLVEPSSKVCKLAVFDAKEFPSISVVSDINVCLNIQTGTAQLSVDGSTLYYETIDAEHIGFEIRAHEIASGVERVVIPSERSDGSKTHFALSGDGKRMLYRRQTNCDSTCLFVFDINSNEQKHVYTSNSKKAKSIANWYNSNNQIVVNDGRKLVFVNVDNNDRTELLLDSDISMDYLSVQGEQEILYTQSNSQKMSLRQVPSPFSSEQTFFANVLVSEGTNHEPNFHLGQLYFISTRTGQSQFWRANGKGRIEQLSAFELTRNYTLYEPMVSADLNYILFKRDNDMEILDLNEQSTYVISEINGALVSSYVFSKSTKAIYFLYANQNVTQLWQFDLITRKKQKLSELDISHLLNDASGNSYYIEKNRLISVKAGLQMELPFQVPRNANLIDMTDKYFYATDGKNAIYKVNIETGKVETKTLPVEVVAISVAANDNSMIYQTASQLETQIKLLTWD